MSNKETPVVDDASSKLIERNEEMKKKKEKYESEMKSHYISVLMSQTTYNEEEAKERLEANNYNVMEAVRDFMGINSSNKKQSVERINKDNKSAFTVNQGIYNHIRGMMDEASYRYEKQKQMEEKLQRIRENYQERVLEKQNENK